MKIVEYKAMAADQLALAAVEINISEIPEGKCQTFEWRGKPVSNMPSIPLACYTNTSGVASTSKVVHMIIDLEGFELVSLICTAC